MKKLLKRLSSTRGEGYIDISVAVLVVMILLVAVIKVDLSIRFRYVRYLRIQTMKTLSRRRTIASATLLYTLKHSRRSSGFTFPQWTTG